MVEQTLTAQEWLNGNALAISIFEKKYQVDNETLDEFFNRVSKGNEDVKNAIRDKYFIFGGRILANRGVTDRKITLSNCYVIEPPQDNLESIFECAKKLAKTYAYGGGCGIDLSNLRPNGAITHNAAKESSGPVSFMDVFSQVTQTISQNGRRGALMISLDVRHPDIEEFIDCKTDLERVKYANISVRVTDLFMRAVENDADYILHYPCNEGISDEFVANTAMEYGVLYSYQGEDTDHLQYYKKVKARDLYNKLIKNNWDYAEPGILFWDRISNYNIVGNDPNFEYAGTNPCAEEPLPAGGSCLLGSINLSEMVADPFTNEANLDVDRLISTTELAVTALNEVLDEGIVMHPLQEQRDSVRDWRQIGLGTLGLGDFLIKLGITYGSKESLEIIDKTFLIIAQAAVNTSLNLAKKQGCYPKCDKKLLANSPFLKALNLPSAIMKEIKKYGLRNSQLLTCAPTGSIGTMLEASTGVEPQFAFKYTRKTISLHGKDTYYEVNAKIVDDYIKVTDNTELPDYFVSSADVNPKQRVAVQGVLQKYIDASISSTINLPQEATVEQVADIYMNAWKAGLKGVTVYRSGCKREGILTKETPKEVTLIDRAAPKRPESLEADFHSVKVNGEQFIVLVGLYEGKPYEVFAFKPNIILHIEQHKGTIIKQSKMHYSFKSDIIEIKDLQSINSDVEERAATLYTSMLLRHGVSIKYIIKTARKVNDNITSFSSAMCRVLSKYLPTGSTGEKCPECGADLIQEGGCCHCPSCGWSRCN